jgi:hypothetical protein
VNEEIEREIDIGISTVDALKGHLENDIPHIQNSLKNEVYEREEQDNIIIKKTSHEFVNLHEQVIIIENNKSQISTDCFGKEGKRRRRRNNFPNAERDN